MKELVGPYRIRSVLGHGGMGVVYLGIHDHLGREVAIKALAPELTQHPQFRERFFAEARVQAKLQHTNIVTIYDLIEDAGSYFIVMEYVPGPTLEDLLKEGSPKGWEIEQILSLFQQVLAGLDYAHSKGVIHRDVKSSNVLISDGDQVKLTDFGIALLIGDKRLTASQSTIGTPTYMSPEQILRPREVDHRSDVYSAAIVLYEMLAGQPPFDAATEYEIKKLQIEAPVPDVRTVNPRVPDAVADAIAVAMRKDPDERFPSAGAFLRALRTQVNPAPVVSTPTGRLDPATPIPPVSVEAAQADLFSKLFLPPWKRWALAASLVLLSGFSSLFLFLPGDEKPVHPEAVAAPPPLPARQAPAAPERPVEKLPVMPPAEPSSAQLASQIQETPVQPSPQPSVIKPPASVPREPTRKEIEEIEREALREGIRNRIQNAQQKIANQDFEGARREVETLRTLVEERPRGLEKEKLLVQRLESSLTEAETAAITRKRESQLREQESRARELIEQSQEIPSPAPRTNRILTITRVKIDPQVISLKDRAVATAHVKVEPPFEQATKVYVRVRVMRNLEEIAEPIQQAVTVPAGGGSWKFRIPIKITKRAPLGGCYVDVEIWDQGQKLKGSGRIGFTIQ